MSAALETPREEAGATILALVKAPAELIAEEGLVVRQANALVITSDDDYNGAQDFLNSVIAAGKKKVHDLFDKHVSRAYQAHRELTSDRAKHLQPWEDAERVVKRVMGEFYTAREQRRLAEQRERERIARAQEEERKRQEAEAERQRAEEEAKRRREEAEAKRVAAEAEAERLRNIEANDKQRREAEERAREIEEQARKDSERAEAEASAIQQAGEAAAQSIESEPVHIAIPPSPEEKLTGVAQTWACVKERWDPVAFAEWIAEDPKNRAKYIGEPAWALLNAEAKQQKSLFKVGGITAAPKAIVRAGRK